MEDLLNQLTLFPLRNWIGGNSNFRYSGSFIMFNERFNSTLCLYIDSFILRVLSIISFIKPYVLTFSLLARLVNPPCLIPDPRVAETL